MNKNKSTNYLMAGIGLGLILINALSYVFNWDFNRPALLVLGLVLTTVGVAKIKKDKSQI